ncbi:MAG: c-type cytochrome [Sphingobacteriaceae bacterium]|nr:c-type cytochrome [Cytophagaceae bacterium]
MNARPLTALLLLLSCQPKTPPETGAVDSVSAASVPTDTAVVALLSLKKAGVFREAKSISIAEDPVYHRQKTYAAVPLEMVLRKIPGYDRTNPANTQVIFECEDGYNPSMPLAKVLSRKAYLAIRDVDAPAGQDWITIKKAGQTKTAAPFYVVYTDVPPDDATFKWPYNLARIRLQPAADELALLHPTGTPERGYALFRTHCLTCHALNGAGGVMGPELNFPKNITEYWREADLRAFVRNPASYRQGTKMPPVAQAQVSDAGLEEILGYLTFMAGHKVGG